MLIRSADFRLVPCDTDDQLSIYCEIMYTILPKQLVNLSISQL